MSELVHIQGKPVQAFEYAGQRVTTFKQIDELHQRPAGTASRNFRANRHHFKEGHHYWELSRDVWRRDIGLAGAFSPKAPSGIVLSERGYLLLTKPFTDDLSWLVQEEMVERFFNPAEPVQGVSVSEMAVMLQDPAFMAKAFGEMIAKAQQLEGQVRELAPKAEFADVVSGAHGSLTVAQAAKVLGYKWPRQLFRWLKENDYLMGNNMPYQHWLNRGLFEVRMTTFNKGDATFNHTQPLITGKGMVHLQQVLGAAQSVALELDANPSGGWV